MVGLGALAMVKLSVCQPVSDVCTGSNPTRGQFFSIFFFTASDAGKAVYIHQGMIAYNIIQAPSHSQIYVTH